MIKASIFLTFCLFIAGTAKAAPEAQHIAASGAVFTLDQSHPALGAASYRDPNGLIWGSKGSMGNQEGAAKFCQSLQARLPTVEEFQQLAVFLGLNQEAYSIFTDDAVTFVLPALQVQGDTEYFWTSTYESEFCFYDGYMGVTSAGHRNAVICVTN